MIKKQNKVMLNKMGFTLVELIVVITILTILLNNSLYITTVI